MLPGASLMTSDQFVPDGRARSLILDLPRMPHSIEQERLFAATQLRNYIWGRVQVVVSPTQAVLLMHLAGWDYGRAVADFSSYDDALNRLHLEFDRMRSGEGRTISRDVAVNGAQERQSERLAILLSITHRPDWGSVQNFLVGCEFNLIAAIFKWFFYGIAVSTKKPDQKKVRLDAYRNPLPLPSPLEVVPLPFDRNWAQEPDFYRRVLGSSVNDDSIAPPPLRMEDRCRAFGYLLFPDRSAIQPGAYHVEDYFVVEIIAKNRYVHSRFSKPEVKKGKGGGKFLWPKLAAGPNNSNAPDNNTNDTDNRVVFDFTNKEHVDLLNAWRRQIFARNTGVLVRPGSQEWQPIELALLYQLVEEFFEQYIATHGAPDDPDWHLPCPRSKLEEFTDALNATFVGTQPGTAIRGERTAEATQTQMRRIAPLCADFSVPEDRTWFAQKEKAQKDYRREQRKNVALGKELLPHWEPVHERLKTSASQQANAIPAKGMHGKKQLAIIDDAQSDPNDSDATRERKLHKKRARAVMIRQTQSRQKKTQERRRRAIEEGMEDDGDEDVFGLRPSVVRGGRQQHGDLSVDLDEDDDGDDEDVDFDDDDDDDDLPPATKRHRHRSGAQPQKKLTAEERRKQAEEENERLAAEDEYEREEEARLRRLRKRRLP